MKKIMMLLATSCLFLNVIPSSAQEVRNYAGYVGTRDCHSTSSTLVCGGPATFRTPQNFILDMKLQSLGDLLGTYTLGGQELGYKFRAHVTGFVEAGTRSEIVQVDMEVIDSQGLKTEYRMANVILRRPSTLQPMILAGNPIAVSPTRSLTPYVFLGPENEVFETPIVFPTTSK